ncbi:hypothetical protein EV284_6393 [Streptomyces sp. BK022]|uniref:hypothetical protein n=1 Tax=Streptomyces sp. BK022 TaxID=2512123 RepID=UPI001028EC59|nr:hypothetical protein [Streptomyces sp. BK022]RZU28227.1 hypothetical protein EV284_6393 [Streptomyces sp. BK022]
MNQNAPAPSSAPVDVMAAIKASGLQLGALVEYDGRTVESPEGPYFVPGGRGRLRDVWTGAGQVIARVEFEDGDNDAPLLADVRPATTLVYKKSSELTEGDIVREDGMRVRLESLDFGRGSHPDRSVYSWTGTVLNMDEVREAGHVPLSFLCTWKSGGVIDRQDVWTVQGNDFVTRAVEAPVEEPAAPRG